MSSALLPGATRQIPTARPATQNTTTAKPRSEFRVT
jgi:hypothetical protein